MLEGTSYPTGGANTHAVISYHRGSPQAKLFTDLPELKGDEFYIEVNGKTLAYQVDQIKPLNQLIQKIYTLSLTKISSLLTCTVYDKQSSVSSRTSYPISTRKAAAGMKKWYNNKIYYYGHYF